MALKLKITVPYIIDTISSVILILPSLTSSPRMMFKSAIFIPAHLLSLLLSILLPLLDSIHKIRSLGVCDMLIFITLSYYSRLFPVLQSNLNGWWRSDATIVLSPSFIRIAFPHLFPESSYFHSPLASEYLRSTGIMGAVFSPLSETLLADELSARIQSPHRLREFTLGSILGCENPTLKDLVIRLGQGGSSSLVYYHHNPPTSFLLTLFCVTSFVLELDTFHLYLKILPIWLLKLSNQIDIKYLYNISPSFTP